MPSLINHKVLSWPTDSRQPGAQTPPSPHVYRGRHCAVILTQEGQRCNDSCRWIFEPTPHLPVNPRPAPWLPLVSGSQVLIRQGPKVNGFCQVATATLDNIRCQESWPSVAVASREPCFCQPLPFGRWTLWLEGVVERAIEGLLGSVPGLLKWGAGAHSGAVV